MYGAYFYIYSKFLELSIKLGVPLISNGTGRVEVFHAGQWGTICDDSWDINDAQVACRQLGYPGALKALSGGEVPYGSGKIWLDELYCTGNESNLSSCHRIVWGRHACSHSEDAGVQCILRGI